MPIFLKLCIGGIQEEERGQSYSTFEFNAFGRYEVVNLDWVGRTYELGGQNLRIQCPNNWRQIIICIRTQKSSCRQNSCNTLKFILIIFVDKLIH